MVTPNISQVIEKIENLNTTFENVTTENLLSNAIQTTNADTGGYAGIIIFAIFSFSVILYLIKNKDSFNLFDEFEMIFAGLCIVIDIGWPLLMFEILTSYQIYIFIVTCFFIMGFVSLMRRDMMSQEV